MTDLAATLYDGDTARRRAVWVDHDAQGLTLHGDDMAETRVEWPALRTIDRLPDAIALGHAERPGWRLLLPLDAAPELVARLARPRRFGSMVDRIGYIPSLALCSLISALIVFAVISAPGWLAPRIPTSWENGMSDDAVGDLSGSTCHTPAADAALARLTAALDRDAAAAHLPPVHVELLKLDEVNAVALPGGRVLVFDGLLHQVDSPDALAGVLGHEIGHVRLRHVMQAVLRQYGIAMLLGNYRSNVTSALGNLTALKFSREAEAEADTWSRQRLVQANVSPLPTAKFLASLDEGNGYGDPGVQRSLAGYLASHPDPINRALDFSNAWRRDRNYAPALSPREFSAIVNACADDTRAKPFNPFAV